MSLTPPPRLLRLRYHLDVLLRSPSLSVQLQGAESLPIPTSFTLVFLGPGGDPLDLPCWDILVLHVQTLIGPQPFRITDPPLSHQVTSLNSPHTVPLTLSRLPSASLPTLAVGYTPALHTAPHCSPQMVLYCFCSYRFIPLSPPSQYVYLDSDLSSWSIHGYQAPVWGALLLGPSSGHRFPF